MEQGWYNLLFAHYAVPASQLRPLIPRELEIDSFDGNSWVSLTPLYIRVRPRGAAPLGRLFGFEELNCRTYVTYRGKPGIFFFSLDAHSLRAVLGARIFYRLPYFHARMSLRAQRAGIHFESLRSGSSHAFLEANYAPVSKPQFPEPGSIEHFLTERYCLYTVAFGRVWRGDIHHGRWPIQQVEAEIPRETVSAAAGLHLSGPPVLTHFSAVQEVLIWTLEQA